MNLSDTLQGAYRLYRQRRFDEAEALLEPALVAHPASADAWRLGGMVARAMGRRDAEPRLLRSLELHPRHPETLNALAGLALDQGRRDEAERCYRAALAASPGHQAVAVNLGRLLLASGRAAEAAALTAPRVGASAPANLLRVHAEALLQTGRCERSLAMFARSLQVEPHAALGRLGRARALVALGRFDDALAAIGRQADETSPEFTLLRAQALVALGRWREALELAQGCARARPDYGRALFLVAQILWMQGQSGETEAFLNEMLARRAGEATDLLCAAIFRGMERFDAATGAIATAESRYGVTPASCCERVNVHLDLAEAGPALEAARRAMSLAGNDLAVQTAAVQAQLMNGRAQEALPIIDSVLASLPQHQFWLAMKADALRQLEDPEYERLQDFERMARVFSLTPPEGFPTIEAYNSALRESLERLHQVQTHPLNQSLKLGTQTHVDLRFVADPVIEAFLAMIRPAIRAYVADMPDDASHPLYARRSADARPTAVWSVRLKSGGRHVSHIHPEGWISSAYYVDVPPSAADETSAGALALGMPPFYQPGASVRRLIPAQAGNLVLFPSYMWHGTVPTTQGSRLSIAFDVTPG